MSGSVTVTTDEASRGESAASLGLPRGLVGVGAGEGLFWRPGSEARAPLVPPWLARAP